MKKLCVIYALLMYYTQGTPCSMTPVWSAANMVQAYCQRSYERATSILYRHNSREFLWHIYGGFKKVQSRIYDTYQSLRSSRAAQEWSSYVNNHIFWLQHTIPSLLLKHGVAALYYLCKFFEVYPHSQSMYARAILKAAVLSGNITFIEELIKHGLDINTRDHKGTTALMMATKLNNYELALFLIEHGADINQCTTSGTTPLMIACQRNALAIVQCLIENRAILDTRDTQGKTALDYTNELGVSVANTDAQDLNEKIKNLLMHHMSMQDLVDAIMGGNDERVEELLQNPVLNVDEFHEGATPLMIAALHGTTRSVAAIMSAGTQYHQANTSGQNVLLLPVTNPEIFHILLRKLYFLAGTSDHRNKTVLMNAIELHGSNKEIIDTLLEQIGKNKAYLNAQDTQGRTALGIARNLQHDYVVQRLQELGAT